MRTELVLDALEQAIWTRAREGRADLADLVHHSDAGSVHLDRLHRAVGRCRRRTQRRLGR
jgi:transposase InsO family protein